MLTGYKEILIHYRIQTVATGLLHMLNSLVHTSDAAFGGTSHLSGRRDWAMTKFDAAMMAVTFAERGEAQTAQRYFSSVAGRLTAGGRRSWGVFAKTAGLGLLSGGLYAALYYFQTPILDFTSKGGVISTAAVIAIAFVFSAAHGAFTGRFWDVIGLKAKR